MRGFLVVFEDDAITAADVLECLQTGRDLEQHGGIEVTLRQRVVEALGESFPELILKVGRDVPTEQVVAETEARTDPEAQAAVEEEARRQKAT